QVTEVCGAKHLGYFGSPQFYVALKLLAAAQSGLPIHLESLTANLPLPRFVGLKGDSEARFSSGPAGGDGQLAACGTSSVSWTPADRSAFPQLEASAKKARAGVKSASSPFQLCPVCLFNPEFVSAPLESVFFMGLTLSLFFVFVFFFCAPAYESKHSSPSRYGPKPAAERASMARTCSSERLDPQTAADHPDSDPWRITEEQLEYYTNQFKSLQPDLGALILGSIAKNFFTKSKLPIPELSHIWELSDVDRDGALTFSEFCTAFHLIVARKNGYPLPESLPPTLRAGFVQQNDEAPETPESPKPLIVFEDAEPRPSQKVGHGSSSSAQDRVIEKLESNLRGDKQELKKEKCSKDVMKRVLTSEEKPQRPGAPDILHPGVAAWLHGVSPDSRSYSSTSFEDAVKKAEEPPTPPPRPQKSHSRASSLDLNKLFQQGAPGVKSGWLPPPPALPPRPSTSQVGSAHARLPLDQSSKGRVVPLNSTIFSFCQRFGDDAPEKGAAAQLCRLQPLQRGVGVSHSYAPQKPARRRYQAENQSVEAVPPPSTSFPTKSAQKLQPRQRREIQMAIRKNKETNAVLTRLNSELQQQLKAALCKGCTSAVDIRQQEGL
ncbi:unnamed protein product, partial [Tetraodon nigroviridis]